MCLSRVRLCPVIGIRSRWGLVCVYSHVNDAIPRQDTRSVLIIDCLWFSGTICWWGLGIFRDFVSKCKVYFEIELI